MSGYVPNIIYPVRSMFTYQFQSLFCKLNLLIRQHLYAIVISSDFSYDDGFILQSIGFRIRTIHDLSMDFGQVIIARMNMPFQF